MDQRAIIAFADWLKQAHGYASAELLHESWSTLARQAIGADGSVLTVRSSAGQLVVHRQGAVAADDDIARTAQLIDADSNAAAESWVSDAAAGSRFFVACPLVQGHAAGVVHRIEKPFHPAELDGCEAVFGALAAALLHRRQIDGLRARLEESERMLSETVHEMRSPLQAVLALAELLKSRETGFNADLSGKIVKNALLCRSILDDMKRASEGGEPLRRPTSLSELVGEALELRLPALLPTVSVRADLEDGEALVSVHPREIRQVILNLVNNAEQAMTEAGMRGEIIVRARVDRAGGKAVIVVADTGPGVPEHVRSKIFEPFFTTRQASGGTGLGLALSQRIVRAHGGSLTLEPPPASGGAMFTITLPLGRAAAPKMATQVFQLLGEVPSGRRVLIVDDDPSIADTYKMVLAPEGFHVEAENRATRALERLNREHFDALLVDVRLPDMTGPEFFARLQATMPNVARTVVFATGDLMNDSTRSFLDQSGNPYLIKPFQIADLKAAIAIAANRSRR